MMWTRQAEKKQKQFQVRGLFVVPFQERSLVLSLALPSEVVLF